MRRLVWLPFALSLAACGPFPRDPDRTEELVRESGTIRLGWVRGTAPEREAAQALAAVARATSARVERVPGDSETLLRDLADGRIDLVYGTFAMASPWAKEVHFGPAIGWRAAPPRHQPAARFAMRNGENRWIMTVEQAVRP
ncbi:type 2 periplasmic-binding domain-containing protein [Pelagerythrobacter marinus]|uniref:hypothetical protein n=1 Tax=Pelagerythrobacter marinus TaxID=538382 RepID=UPI002036DE14|nr:hypothetical protein [Pelagerythrobacter marinus]USA39375.1 hypothetical protein NCF86_13970 [Pelagerythrobacter marinus]WPZ06485.1 hypothetical protein T8T98_13880 [Pelagerythrobacter marinus]